MGVENITAVDGNAARLEFAKRMGADNTVNFMEFKGIEALTEGVKASFGGYANTASTVFPDLYYLPDSHVAEERLLKQSLPGFYPVRGDGRVYTAGSDQISIHKTVTGEVTFSLLNPKELTVMQLTGLRETIQKDQVLSIVEITYVKTGKTEKTAQPYRVIRIQDDKAWLLHPGGDGYIVRIR